MTDEQKNKIYDRLLAIEFKIDTEPVLDPRYLNEKIGELHLYIGEVEKFSIQVSKETSEYQRSLNNAEAKYEEAKESLLTDDTEIKNLPNIKDREAKANSKLKEDLQLIQKYKGEVSDLNNLLKAINLKLKNLGRANSDIRMQLRIMESQIKLGQAADPKTQDIRDELKKSLAGKDSFQNISSESTQQNVVDPSKKSLADDLFGDDDKESDEEAQEEQESEDVTEDLVDPYHQPAEITEELEKEAEKSMSSEGTIDLDKALDENPTPAPQKEPDTGGDASAQKKETPSAETEKVKAEPQNNSTKSTGKIDIDELLEQYN